MTDDLKARLRHLAEVGIFDAGTGPLWTEAADRIETLEAALKPFARVCAAFDYWVPEVMPDFGYPVAGTNLSLALADAPDAVGRLDESDFRNALAAVPAQPGDAHNTPEHSHD